MSARRDVGKSPREKKCVGGARWRETDRTRVIRWAKRSDGDGTPARNDESECDGVERGRPVDGA